MAYRQPVSTIMLCRGYPCDREHENTLYFASKSAQWTYMKSLVKYTYSAQSYQRYAKNTLRIAQRADDLYDCNYLIFSNSAISTASTPSDSTPIFYAFVDKVEYINDNCTEVVYTLDPIQTFWFNFSLGECYVEREHTETDYRYGNLVPEDMEVKAYYHKTLETVNLLRFDETGATSSVDLWSILFVYMPGEKYCDAVDSYTSSTPNRADPDSYNIVPSMHWADTEDTGSGFSNKGEMRNGVYNNAKYLYLHLPPITTANIGKITNILKSVASRFDAVAKIQILSVTMVPRIFAQTPNNWTTPSAWTPPDGATATVSKTISITRPTSLNGPSNATYTPRNKKLLSYPFCSIKIDNGEESKEFAWEYVDGIGATFMLKGVVAPAPEIVVYPDDYLGESTKYTENGVFTKNFVNTAWTIDGYQQYLQSNQNSIVFGFITSAIGTIAGIVAAAGTGGAGAALAVSGAAGLATSFANLEDRKSMPDRISGASSFSALRNTLGMFKYSFEQANVYPAAAERIDKYFDMYGYAVNTVKVPNIKASGVTLRPHWNYVKTNGAVVLPASNTGSGSAANSASVDELEAIKKIFDKGVRFWTTASEVGKYSSYSNAPVTPTP